ncbi:MAG TPA: DUF924 family protein [Casimicrobiaceae bacterium]
MVPAEAEAVLAFWFAPANPATTTDAPFAERPEWFGKDAAFDGTIRTRFGALIAQALAGGLGDWTTTARGSLARVIVLDQLTRNAFRDTPDAFAGDARALATADAAIARGFDRELAPMERWFLYMPFVHSETIDDQERSVKLFRALADETGLRSPLPWAERHAGVIRRFGRFPHRNAILQRESTPEEIEFLRTPGSRF